MANNDQTQSMESENLESTNVDHSETSSEDTIHEAGELSSDNSKEQENKELKDKYVRLVAEFENYKKRKNKEISDLIRNAGEDVMKSLLEVMDDYDRAQDQLNKSEDVTSLKEGVDLIFTKMLAIFKSKGLKEMEAQGVPFDPDFHEAIAEFPAASPELEGTVFDVVQKGYLLNDKIIRHAKVVIAK